MEFSWPMPERIGEGSYVFDNWIKFYSRYMAFLKGNENKPLSLLLHAGGKEMEKICSSLGRFDIDVSVLGEVLLLLEPLCVPNLLVLFERFKLCMYKQKQSQNIDNFLWKLEKRASKCYLGKARDEVLVNCIIEGIRQNHLKKILRAAQNLDFDKASSICKEQNRINNYSSCNSFNFTEGKYKCDQNKVAIAEVEKDNSEQLGISEEDDEPMFTAASEKNRWHQIQMNAKSSTHSGAAKKYFESSGGKLRKVKHSADMKVDPSPFHKQPESHSVEKNKVSNAASDSETLHTVELKRVNQNEKLTCKVCDQSFKSPSLLKRHCIKHSQEKQFSCTVCGHKLKRKAEIKVHMRKHSNQRDFKCSECGYAFMRSDHLKAHMRIHSGEKPYSCEICHKAFPYLTSLSVHKNCHDSSVTDRNYKYTCEICGKSFSQRTPFTNHLRIHTGEKPYPCSDCEKCFSSKPLLKQHMRIHSGELAFICDICGKRFRHNQNLHMHKKAHAGKRSYVCDLCGAAYLYIKNLKQHKKSAHTVNIPGRQYKDSPRTDI